MFISLFFSGCLNTSGLGKAHIYVSVPLIRCDTEDILPAHWLLSPLSPLCPLWDVTGAKHKAVFHGAGAYLASESMWDMPGNKGASLRPLAGWAYPFHRPHISLPLLIWQAHGDFYWRRSTPGKGLTSKAQGPTLQGEEQEPLSDSNTLVVVSMSCLWCRRNCVEIEKLNNKP